MIVITGASDGLGLQLARVFKEAGKQVINVSRTDSEYADVNLLTDLRDTRAIENTAQKINQMDEPLEVLINCAGVMTLEKVESISASEIQRVFDINIEAPILLTSQLVAKMRQDGSDIINVASTVGTRPHYDNTVYGSTKWAMRGFSQNLQLELKGTNRVVSFCIGGFKSTIAEKHTGEPMKDPENWMDPEDIAGFVKNIVDLPKNMEVAEIIINRAAGKKVR